MSIYFRPPRPDDGAALYHLVKRCPPLDVNSRYCNLLQVAHFSDTAIVAERERNLCGFVTGFRVPGRENVLFVWQVGVSPEGRGQRLAQRMLVALIERLDGISHLETTVTPTNGASQATFEKVARALGAPLERSVLFAQTTHFEGKHEDEVLYRIGPFASARVGHQPHQLKDTGT